MKEAILYQSLPGERVVCNLCHHRCIIPQDSRGLCGVRKNDGGRLYSLNYGKTISVAADPIEKKPLRYYMPGTKTYSLASEGCNMRCAWCQNWEISQQPGPDRAIRGAVIKPEEHVKKAFAWKCRSVSFTYSEPTVFTEYALEIMKKAHNTGLKNIWVTNGFMTPEALEQILPYLDAANIDLKAFEDTVYQKYCGGRLAPVLENIRTIYEAGVHVELTTLVVPGVNDDAVQLAGIAGFISSKLDPSVPWHISRFFPAWRMTDRQPTPAETMKEAEKLGKEAGLRRIHLGNISL
ncbi:MAG: AmmeMemoRadiSam system radical SAM enzyme [Eubacteriales bacterium]|jgi:pyruvate formate lyase activating enzyme|nr:AmmeMemoRadiSam system radical SAM enzyme [Eubacteriales bacterium]MDD3289982.1 AmmeMemoRadiSam system radical SAM enzyme [Eubacteriales bacterium]MDD3864453.1 AmmeMemoRadiSam system radical SAM enzyme [Eubacteriales bacterium]